MLRTEERLTAHQQVMAAGCCSRLTANASRPHCPCLPGPRHTYYRDLDGTLTGTANTTLLGAFASQRDSSLIDQVGSAVCEAWARAWGSAAATATFARPAYLFFVTSARLRSQCIVCSAEKHAPAAHWQYRVIVQLHEPASSCQGGWRCCCQVAANMLSGTPTPLRYQGSPLATGPCSYNDTLDSYACLPGATTAVGLPGGWPAGVAVPAKGIFGDPQMFVLESRDPDSEARNFGPVIVDVNGVKVGCRGLLYSWRQPVHDVTRAVHGSA
jgi:hypothetical protein